MSHFLHDRTDKICAAVVLSALTAWAGIMGYAIREKAREDQKIERVFERAGLGKPQAPAEGGPLVNPAAEMTEEEAKAKDVYALLDALGKRALEPQMRDILRKYNLTTPALERQYDREAIEKVVYGENGGCPSLEPRLASVCHDIRAEIGLD